MADSIFEKGREGFAGALVDWDTDTIKCAIIDLAVADAGIKAITGATNATPIVITATAHGFANGDIVAILKVGGNAAANGVWKIANAAANTFELTDPITNANASGSGVYTSGGYAICLGPSAAGDFWDDFSAAVKGTPQTLATPTLTNGVLDAADPSFASISNVTDGVLAIYKDTGVETTSRMLILLDGQQIVTCAAQAAAAATSIAVERLRGGIPSGTVLAFSNGASATLSAAANAGDRTLTVSALAAAITAGSRAQAPITNAGLPLNVGATPVTVNVTFDNGPNKIAKL